MRRITNFINSKSFVFTLICKKMYNKEKVTDLFFGHPVELRAFRRTTVKEKGKAIVKRKTGDVLTHRVCAINIAIKNWIYEF